MDYVSATDWAATGIKHSHRSLLEVAFMILISTQNQKYANILQVFHE